MQSVFPEFKWFAQPPRFGFQGYLRGKNTNRLYAVVLEANEKTYPQVPPNVYIDPRVGHHWIQDIPPKLCVEKEWIPSRSTFANTLLAAIKYLEEFDA